MPAFEGKADIAAMSANTHRSINGSGATSVCPNFVPNSIAIRLHRAQA